MFWKKDYTDADEHRLMIKSWSLGLPLSSGFINVNIYKHGSSKYYNNDDNTN
jgi:hypothetical protein